MIKAAIKKTPQYFDPKNGTINYILENGGGAGKDLLVGQNPVTGVITTVIKGANLLSGRMIPLQ